MGQVCSTLSGLVGREVARECEAAPCRQQQSEAGEGHHAMPLAGVVNIAQAVLGAQGVPVSGGLAEGVAIALGVPLSMGTPVAKRPVVLSKLTGRRRSLLVGINYAGQKSQLGGCINDVNRMRPLLEKLGFPATKEEQLVLLDDGKSKLPTRTNILEAFHWLVDGAKTGDILFFHYSGHGGRQSSTASATGYSETLVPVDYQSAGQILDTEMFDALVRTLPSGCKLTCLLDCCHSAGALNLPYIFTGTAENLDRALAGHAIHMVMSKNWAKDFASWREGTHTDLLQDVASLGLGLWSLWKQRKEAKSGDATGFCTDEPENVGIAVGEVIAISGCRSDQTSADVGDVNATFHLHTSPTASINLAGKGGGALTSVFIESVEEGENYSYLSLLEKMRQRLAEHDYTQVPQLVSSLLVALDQPFAFDVISLPADPSNLLPGDRKDQSSAGSDASGFGAAGFLAAIAAAAGGDSMLSSAHDPNFKDSQPYANMASSGGAAGLLRIFCGASPGSESGNHAGQEQGSSELAAAGVAVMEAAQKYLKGAGAVAEAKARDAAPHAETNAADRRDADVEEHHEEVDEEAAERELSKELTEGLLKGVDESAISDAKPHKEVNGEEQQHTSAEKGKENHDNGDKEDDEQAEETEQPSCDFQA